jgi:NAD(P)-dependent dehydrogenase (short-subunit alcohol dehydrogenase family)
MPRMNQADHMKAFDLTGQSGLITGGATGLGFAMASCLVAAGASVVMVRRREAKLRSACAALGSKSFPLQGDVTKLDGAADLVERTERLAGALTLLVNNAGVHLKKPAIETSDAEFADVLQTHVLGAFALTREVGRRMVERKSGCVLFTASMSSFMGMPRVVAYATAKTAYLGLVRSLAVEWGPHGVRVNAIASGWIASDMLDRALAGDPSRQERILARTPMARFGEPEDIGWTVVFLASPAAKFINGTILPVDGGAAIAF